MDKNQHTVALLWCKTVFFKSMGLEVNVMAHPLIFLQLFVLMDAILLNLDLQKRTPGLINFSTVYTFAYH